MPPPVNPITRQELRKLIQGESWRLWATCKDSLGVLSEWDDRSILWLNARLWFEFIDGVVRIVGIVDAPQVSWREIQRQAEGCLCPWNGDKLLDTLVQLFLQCGDRAPIQNLLVHLLLHYTAQEELKRRLSLRPYSRAWRDYLSERDPKKRRVLEKKLTQDWNVRQGKIKRPLRGWYALPHGTKESGPDERIPQDKDRIATALEALANLHASQQARLDPLSLAYVPTLASRLPGQVVPGWDAAAPGLLEEDVRILQDEWLPILKGSMEHGPLKIKDAYRAEYERERTEERNGEEYSLDTILEDAESEEEETPRHSPPRATAPGSTWKARDAPSPRVAPVGGIPPESTPAGSTPTAKFPRRPHGSPEGFAGGFSIHQRAFFPESPTGS